MPTSLVTSLLREVHFSRCGASRKTTSRNTYNSSSPVAFVSFPLRLLELGRTQRGLKTSWLSRQARELGMRG